MSRTLVYISGVSFFPSVFDLVSFRFVVFPRMSDRACLVATRVVVKNTNGIPTIVHVPYKVWIPTIVHVPYKACALLASVSVEEARQSGTVRLRHDHRFSLDIYIYQGPTYPDVADLSDLTI